MKRALIIGGGAAGLSCALHLAQRRPDLKITLLESASRVGGRIGTHHQGSWQVEAGPATLQERSEGLIPLLERIGLGPRLAFSDARASKRYLCLGGRLRAVPSAPPQLIASDILPLSAKLRMLREPLIPRGSADVDESIGDFVRRRLGPDTAPLIDAILSGIFAGDMNQLSLRSAFPTLYQMEQDHGGLVRGGLAMAVKLIKQRRSSDAPKRPRGPARLVSLRGGLGELAEALGAAITQAGGEIRCDAPVRALLRDAPDGPWLVKTDAETLSADLIVLAVPPPAAQALLQPVDPAAAAAYAQIPMSGVAAVSLGYAQSEVPHPLDGFGFLVPRGEPVSVLGVLFMTTALPTVAQAPPGHVVLRAMVGGARDPGAPTRDEPELLDQVRADLRTTLGITATPRFIHVQRWPQAIEQYVIGHRERIADIESRLQRQQVFVTGAAYHGISVPDVLKNGQTVADQIAERVAPR